MHHMFLSRMSLLLRYISERNFDIASTVLIRVFLPVSFQLARAH